MGEPQGFLLALAFEQEVMEWHASILDKYDDLEFRMRFNADTIPLHRIDQNETTSPDTSSSADGKKKSSKKNEETTA